VTSRSRRLFYRHLQRVHALLIASVPLTRVVYTAGRVIASIAEPIAETVRIGPLAI
jgi:hypothetical protein